MELSVLLAEKAAIARQYEQNMALYPTVHREVDTFLQSRPEAVRVCAQYLYAHMAAQDVLSVDPAVIASYAQASLQALAQIDYVKAVPADIFFPYVLYHRVNSECLDDSRGLLLAELLPLVRGKTLEQAALAVNYWCCAHATYTPADDRTLGPLAMLRRTLGRCGEESVLAVAALRSVGIPARQCYCPRWSHCDDNHAWAEVWIDGSWHYLGACEPEPVLDRGWFTAAASRAMLVDTKCWAGEALFSLVNCTAHYGHTQKLTVRVTEDGRPAVGAQVRLQIVNYSELFTLLDGITDENGCIQFETGRGDAFLFARFGSKVALQKVDLRQASAVTLPLQAAFPAQITADLVPPADSSDPVLPREDPVHRARMAQCEAHLAARRACFAEHRGYFGLAALNTPQLQAFWVDDRYSRQEKQALLSTLRPKDLVDITHETLADVLDAATPVSGKYSADIFQNYILAPRIADEMLLPERKPIRGLFPEGFAGPEQILVWMRSQMQILPDQGITNYYPSAYGCLRHKQVPGFAFDMVFVALCRAFGFPARLDEHTRQGQWLDQTGVWHAIHPTAAPIRLTLALPDSKQLHYFEHLTIGHWNGSDFATLQYPDLTLAGSHTFCLQPGLYRITVTTRQIDGTASVHIHHLSLQADQPLSITPPEDQTPQRLKQIPLQLPDGPLQQLLLLGQSQNQIFLFTDPGSEPTEHLLREMLDRAPQFRALSCRILLAAETPEDLAHPTVQLVHAALPNITLACFRDPDALTVLHKKMQVGDLRLPFVLCADRQFRGVYAEANYRIRLAQTLLEIQKLLA